MLFKDQQYQHIPNHVMHRFVIRICIHKMYYRRFLVFFPSLPEMCSICGETLHTYLSYMSIPSSSLRENCWKGVSRFTLKNAATFDSLRWCSIMQSWILAKLPVRKKKYMINLGINNPTFSAHASNQRVQCDNLYWRVASFSPPLCSTEECHIVSNESLLCLRGPSPLRLQVL